MAKRWTEDDIFRLKNMAAHCAVPFIAEEVDRSVGGILFKAHKLKIGFLAGRPSRHYSRHGRHCRSQEGADEKACGRAAKRCS